MVRNGIKSLLVTLSLFCGEATFAVDCDGNGVDDALELAQDPRLDCNSNGTLDICDVREGSRNRPGVAVSHPAQREPLSLTIADLTGDGLLEFAAANSVSDSVSVYGNRGSRTIELDKHYPTGDRPGDIACGDFNGDGHNDLVTANRADGTVSVLYNLGPGLFTSPRVVFTSESLRAFAVSVGDVDEDGFVDVLLPGAGPFGLSLLRNDEGFGFHAPESVSIGPEANSLLLVDLDRDGHLDLVTTHNPRSGVSPPGELRILRGDGTGRFGRSTVVAESLTWPQRAKAADLDGDGRLDLVVGQNVNRFAGVPRIVLLLAREDGSYEVDEGLLREGSSPTRGYRALEVADVDGDGFVDVLFAGLEPELLVLYGDGAGSISDLSRHSITAPAREIQAADIDGDGHQDIASVGYRSGDGAGLVEVLFGERASVSRDCNRNDIPDECEIVSQTSPDCNSDGIPDECQLDCNENDVVDDCEIARGLVGDCNQNGLIDVCELESGIGGDCDGNGVLDVCDGIDCNGNGIGDSCDIEHGLASDDNGNGVPDSCEDRPIVIVSVAALSEPSRSEQGLFLQEYGVYLDVSALDPRGPSVSGWSNSIGIHGGCHLVGYTFDSTVAAFETDDPPGLVRSGFRFVNTWHPPADSTSTGVTSAVVLSFLEPLTLPVQEEPHLVLRFSIEVEAVVDGPCRECGIQPERSEFGYPQGGFNVVTIDGDSIDATPVGARARFCRRAFHRGDSTADGQLDISDGVAIVAHLFLGRPAPACLDAADSNADGRLDLSDTVFVLGHLFLGAPPPPPPGPPGDPCGHGDVDPVDMLGCASYPPCNP